MKLISTAVCAVAALAAAPAFAGDNPAWTYGQLGYYRADSGDDATDGFRVKGSLGIADLFHVQAEYIDGTIGVAGDSDIDFDGFRIVGGVNPHVGASTDAVVEIQYFDLSYDDPLGDIDGFGLGVGLRHMLTDKLELSGMAWWNEGNGDNDSIYGGDISDVALEIGGRYLFTPNFSAGVNIVTNDSIVGGDSATIDVRYQFGDIL